MTDQWRIFFLKTFHDNIPKFNTHKNPQNKSINHKSSHQHLPVWKRAVHQLFWRTWKEKFQPEAILMKNLISLSMSHRRHKQDSTVLVHLCMHSLGRDTTASGSSCRHSLVTSCWWRQESLDCIWCPSLLAGCHLLLHKGKVQVP